MIGRYTGAWSVRGLRAPAAKRSKLGSLVLRYLVSARPQDTPLHPPIHLA